MKKSEKIVSALLAIVLLISVFTAAATTGDYPNPGAISPPWRTIQHAGETIVAGDTVYINGCIAPSPDYDDGPSGGGYDTGAYEPANTNEQSIIVNYTYTNLSQIPEVWVTAAKDNLHIAYGHTSHGSQLITGMDGLDAFMGGTGLYVWNDGPSANHLDIDDYAFDDYEAYDLGNPNLIAWVQATRDYLDANSDVNVVLWSWCGQLSWMSTAEVTNYLNNMATLETEYPSVYFVYMTGHLNIWDWATTKANNQQIRDYCIANDKILYDFADIESYDPAGVFYDYANDNCDYYDDQYGSNLLGNWAQAWQSTHTEGEGGDWYDCECAHSQPLNCNQKAYAAWWLWARLAGWDGSTTPPTTCGCVGATQNFTCGDAITESCTLNCNLNSNGTCFTIGANDITIDGAGHSITGNSTGNGIDVTGINNVTIKDIKIYDFIHGIYLEESSNNNLIDSIFTLNKVGIYSYSSNSAINSNYVCNNTDLDFNSPDWLSSSGDNNTCDKPDGWNDDGASGCTYSCGVHPMGFDTGAGTYPSIMGNHTGTIKTNHTVIATKMYTYPCPGTGGHTEYARIWNSTWHATATWEGYRASDWHNVTFDKTVVLLASETYNYCIRTGSYPQIHHTDELKVDDVIIRCDKFVDANGKIYNDWIPAIRFGREEGAAQLVQPEDFQYLGAFRLPGDGIRPNTFAYGGNAMTFNPNGDSSGPADGFLGSLFVTGHDRMPYGELPDGSQVAEVSIPVPVISNNPEELSQAEFLQDFHEVTGNLFGGLEEIPRIGMQYLSTPATGPNIHLAWGQHFHEGAEARLPSHAWINLDLSAPDPQGAWYIGNQSLYSVNGYLFEIPESWADEHAKGRYLGTGRFRDGGWSGMGPTLFAYQPWIDDAGTPAPPGMHLEETVLLLYEDSYNTENIERCLDGYQHPDEWEGGAWITTKSGKLAVLFAGTKGTGAKYWYGYINPAGPEYPCVDDDFVGQFDVCRLADGTPCPVEDLTECEGHSDYRGWWSSWFDAQFILYDPGDIARVAAGEIEPYEPQPYASMDLDEYLLLNPGEIEEEMLGTGVQRIYRIGAVAYDRSNDLLYVLELFADGAKPVVHVWQVR
jgi:parallel beta-helix repeat protein